MCTRFHKEIKREEFHRVLRTSVVEAFDPLERQKKSHCKIMPRVLVLQKMGLPSLQTPRLSLSLVSP